MSCYFVTIEQGHKVARSVGSRLEYLALRGTPGHLNNLQHARAGNDQAKRRLVQFNYSGHFPQGTVKGCKLPSGAFGFDVDSKEDFERIMPMLVDPRSTEPTPLGLSLHLLMLEHSVNQGGHAIFARQPGRTILENQVRIASTLRCEMDTNAHDINRVYFATSASPDDLIYVSDALFADAYDEASVAAEAQLLADREQSGREELPEGAHKANKHFKPFVALPPELPETPESPETPVTSESPESPETPESPKPLPTTYLGVPYATYIAKWWELHNHGMEPVRSNRNTLTFELAVNMRHIMDFDRELMAREIPCYDGFDPAEKMRCIDSALAEKRTQMPKRLKDVLTAVRSDQLKEARINPSQVSDMNLLDQVLEQDELFHYERLPKLPMGVSDSVNATGHPMAMATLVAIAPAIGALATGVKLDVHGRSKGLNLCSFVVGEAASGKGQLDDVIGAWTYELQSEADLYYQQEEEWAAKASRMKSGKMPEQPVLPVRMLPLNNTIRNIELRLSHTDGKHAFSFTPEADNMVQAWHGGINNFSVLLRQAYDEARYDREAKSADAVRVHIRNVMWNTVLCGTEDALYRVVTNYTDGLLSRISIARTPDNTFAPLAENPPQLTEVQAERIRQVAHLLPLMQGQVVLNKLEQHGREWVETIRLEGLMNGDTVLARQRMRGCVNAQRLTCALWLPYVAETLIRKHGMAGAETRLKQNPKLWIEMLQKAQGKPMMQLFDLLADYLVDNELFYFGTLLKKANANRISGVPNGFGRTRQGKNDSIFERLDHQFSFDDAYHMTVAMKGSEVTRNSVHQMLKNWRKQGLIDVVDCGSFCKLKLGSAPTPAATLS